MTGFATAARRRSQPSVPTVARQGARRTPACSGSSAFPWRTRTTRCAPSGPHAHWSPAGSSRAQASPPGTSSPAIRRTAGRSHRARRSRRPTGYCAAAGQADVLVGDRAWRLVRHAVTGERRDDGACSPERSGRRRAGRPPPRDAAGGARGRARRDRGRVPAGRPRRQSAPGHRVRLSGGRQDAPGPRGGRRARGLGDLPRRPRHRTATRRRSSRSAMPSPRRPAAASRRGPPASSPASGTVTRSRRRSPRRRARRRRPSPSRRQPGPLAG